MPAWLRIVWNFIKSFWWIIVLVLAFVLFVLGGFIISGRRKKEGREVEEVESFVETATNRVADAITDVKVETAVIKTKSDIERKQLEAIRKEPNGKIRRKKLAAILQKSL